MTVPVEKPASPGTAHQSRKLSTDNVPRNRTSKGFRRNPRSNAAPRKGAVSAAMAPAHFDRDATTACPDRPQEQHGGGRYGNGRQAQGRQRTLIR